MLSKKLKKVILSISIIAFLLIPFIFFFASSERVISQTVLINTNQYSLIRFFSDDDKTNNWLKAETRKTQNNKVKIIEIHHFYSANLVSLKVKVDDDVINSEMQIISASVNATYIRWQFDRPSGKNVIKKMEAFLKRKTIDGNVRQILSSLKNYTERSENIYGFTIRKIKVKDTLLVVAKSFLTSYPGVPYIYDQIGRLQQYISRQQVQQSNFPMLYIHKTGDGVFETTVALPIKMAIKNEGKMTMQRMVAGDILCTECKGGPSKISKAFSELENYMQDNQHSSPAFPFESLVTDRLKHSDTVNWITRIYYPVY